MINPLKILANEFVRRTPLTLLLAGISISALEFVVLFWAANREGVLHIQNGVGLLDNYGLISTLLGNAIFPCLARSYYEYVCTTQSSKAVKNSIVVEREISVLKSMLKLEGRYRFGLYVLMFVGAGFWVSNTSFHVLGNAEVHWGHKVFDSTNHPLCFYLNRINNFYTWMIVLPFCGHVMIFSSVQLVTAINRAIDGKVIVYDLLNHDKCGGFLPIERAHVIYNVIIAMMYVQIALHTETFNRMNAEHMMSYIAATIILLFGNRLFLGGIYHEIRKLRISALNECKERVYRGDKLSFEILKYCYEPRANKFSMVNGVTKTVAMFMSVMIKAAPIISAYAPSFS
jgi:hypothetical protein